MNTADCQKLSFIQRVLDLHAFHWFREHSLSPTELGVKAKKIHWGKRGRIFLCCKMERSSERKTTAFVKKKKIACISLYLKYLTYHHTNHISNSLKDHSSLAWCNSGQPSLAIVSAHPRKRQPWVYELPPITNSAFSHLLPASVCPPKTMQGVLPFTRHATKWEVKQGEVDCSFTL